MPELLWKCSSFWDMLLLLMSFIYFVGKFREHDQRNTALKVSQFPCFRNLISVCWKNASPLVPSAPCCVTIVTKTTREPPLQPNLLLILSSRQLSWPCSVTSTMSSTTCLSLTSAWRLAQCCHLEPFATWKELMISSLITAGLIWTLAWLQHLLNMLSASGDFRGKQGFLESPGLMSVGSVFF